MFRIARRWICAESVVLTMWSSAARMSLWFVRRVKKRLGLRQMPRKPMRGE
jgi:hypothetical protein